MTVTLQVLLIPILAIVGVWSMLKVLYVADANHFTGIWPEKTLMDVQSANVMWPEH